MGTDGPANCVDDFSTVVQHLLDFAVPMPAGSPAGVEQDVKVRCGADPQEVLFVGNAAVGLKRGLYVALPQKIEPKRRLLKLEPAQLPVPMQEATARSRHVQRSDTPDAR